MILYTFYYVCAPCIQHSALVGTYVYMHVRITCIQFGLKSQTGRRRASLGTDGAAQLTQPAQRTVTLSHEEVAGG